MKIQSFIVAVSHITDRYNDILINETVDSILDEGVNINKPVGVHYDISSYNRHNEVLTTLRDALLKNIKKRKTSHFHIIQET